MNEESIALLTNRLRPFKSRSCYGIFYTPFAHHTRRRTIHVQSYMLIFRIQLFLHYVKNLLGF